METLQHTPHLNHTYHIHREKEVNSRDEVEPSEEEEKMMEAKEEGYDFDLYHITSEETLIEADVARLLHKDLEHHKRCCSFYHASM